MKIKNYKEINVDEFFERGIECCDQIYLKDDEDNLYRLEVDFDEFPENPRDDYNVCTIISGGKNDWDISDKGYSLNYSRALEILNVPDTYYRSIYMYDHSGQTISLSPFGDKWDSGLCGFIFVTKDRLKEVGFHTVNDTEEEWQSKAYEIMEQEINAYDKYIRGDIYSMWLSKAERVHHTSESGKEWDTILFEEIDQLGNIFGQNGVEDEIKSLIKGSYTLIEINEEDLR